MSTFYDDEYSGMGGTYLLDPVTGARTLVERTQEPGDPAPVQSPITPVEAQE
jgi:hypothetical protein